MKDNLTTVWNNVAKKINGTIKHKENTNSFNNYESYTINCHHNSYKIVITTYLQLTPERGKGTFLTHFTRLYVPFTNKQRSYFKIAKNGFLDGFYNLFYPKIKTPNETFNKRFNLTGRPRSNVASIFSKQETLQLIVDLDDLYLKIIPHNKFSADFEVSSKEDVFEINVNYVLNNEAVILKFIDFSVQLVQAVTATHT